MGNIKIEKDCLLQTQIQGRITWSMTTSMDQFFPSLHPKHCSPPVDAHTIGVFFYCLSCHWLLHERTSRKKRKEDKQCSEHRSFFVRWQIIRPDWMNIHPYFLFFSLSLSRCILDDTSKTFMGIFLDSMSQSHHDDVMMTMRDARKEEWNRREWNFWHSDRCLSRQMPWYWPFEEDPSLPDTYSLEEAHLIEGISDDTILLVIFTVGLIGMWIYYAT